MPRQKKCRACGERFTPYSTLDRACSPPCAIKVVEQDKSKAQRKETKRRKEAIKTRSDLLKEAQAAFNWYIRERDADKPCISCGVTEASEQMTGGGWDCGHYRSTGGNPELRFEETNAHKQCKRCNQYLSGNVTNYRIGLRQRIGDDVLTWLEGPHDPAKHTADRLRQIRDDYRKRARELKRQREAK